LGKFQQVLFQLHAQGRVLDAADRVEKLIG
jgi:hypothetical protein